MRQHAHSLAAQHQLFESAVAVRTHDDKVAAILFCGIDDRQMRRVTVNVCRIAFDAGFYGLGHYRIKHCTRSFGNTFFPLALTDAHHGSHEPLIRELSERGRHQDDRGFCLERLCQFDGAAAGLRGERTAIGWNQNLCKHNLPFVYLKVPKFVAA